MKERIQKDLAALADESAAQLRTLDQTAELFGKRETSSMKTPTPKNGLKLAIAAGVVMIGGAVFAATAGDLFSVAVHTEGKTDEQISDELRDQLEGSGVEEAAARFRREGDEATVELEGRRGDRVFEIVQKTAGEGEGVVHVQPPALDTEREPGMSDEALKAKIERQIAALGLQGSVTVAGDDVEVMVHQEVQEEE